MTSTADALDSVLGSAPELNTAPDLAVSAASSPDPVATGQALAHTSNGMALDQAQQTVAKKVGHPNFIAKTLGFLHSDIARIAAPLAGPVGLVQDIADVPHRFSQATHLANAGLQEVQHEYRTLHDVEARHGPVVGLLEALGLAGAGIAAAVAAPETGGGSLAAFGGVQAGILGAEAATAVASRTVLKDSWDRTEHGAAYQGIYNRQTGTYSGGPVSMGRDLADHLPHPLRFVSGWTDGLADLTLDPTVQAGKVFAAAREARLAVNSAADLDRAMTSPLTRGSVNRAFEQIAGESSASQIALHYPKFEGIAQDLSKLTTSGEVASYFRDNLASAEFLSRTPGTIPNLPLTRVPFQQAADFVRGYEGPGNGALRVFTLLPSSLDEETLRLSNKEFDPAGNTWAKGVYRVIRYGQTDRVARQVTDAMLATDDLGARRAIYVNGVQNMLNDGLGLSENNRFRQHIMQALENTTPDLGGPEQVYAATADGRNLSILPATDSGPARAAAVFENQTGKWAFPDFNEVLRAKRAEGAITNLLGAADDGFYHHFTEPIFKRAALLTGGFALRIAAAEAIPAAFREGFGNLVKSSIQLHAGADRIGEEETGHIAAAVQRLIGGVTKDSIAKNAEDVDLATRVVLANKGHLVSPALEAGGGAPNFLDGATDARASLLDKMLKRVPPERRFGDAFGIFGPGPENWDTWQKALKEAGNSELGQAAAGALHDSLSAGADMPTATRNAMDAVQNVLDTKDEKWLGKFERHFTSTTDLTPHEDWSKVVTDAVKGVTGHPYDESKLHLDLLDHLANGTTPPKDLLDSIAAAERPMAKGRIEMPNIPDSPVAALANGGYRRLDGIINFLSREPIYFNELKTQYAPLRDLVQQGLLSDDEALRVAQVRTVNAVTPFIHNPMERSQFAQIARNFMPFYFAQTQAYRRVGRLLLDNPGAFRQYQLSTTALHDIGHVTTDGSGNPQFVLPGAGFLGQAAATSLNMLGFPVQSGVPVAFTGNVQSLNTVFPFAEDQGGIGIGPFRARLGPLVSIPMHAVETLFPEVGIPAANAVLGPAGAGGGFLDQLIPNTPVRNLLKSAGVLGGGRELTNATVQAIQSLQFQQQQAMTRWEKNGEKGPRPDIAPAPDAAPDVKQRFVSRVRNQARVLMFTKALISTVSPVSPQLQVGDLGLQKELTDLIASKGPDGRPLGMGGAVTAFLAKHPDATAYTVFGSKNVSGADLPANHPAQGFLDAHLDLLHKYPSAAAWLIPQSADPFSQTIYNEQLAMGLRVKKSPEQVQNDIYIAMGNDQFFNRDLPAHQKAIAAAEGDPEATKAENANWNTYLTTQLGPQNPIWWDDFQSKDRADNRVRAITQLTQMFQNGDAPPGPQTSAVKSLLDDYRTHQAAVASGRSDSWSAEERDAEKQNWLGYLAQLAKDKPILAPIINSVFRSAP